MRVLKFAGFELISSEKNLKPVSQVDPHGIYELENLRELADHPAEWTANKVIKIVTPYIPKVLPLDRPLKVVFMLRDISEIVASLMVQRTIWEDDPWNSIQAGRRFLEARGIPTHFVHYSDVMKYPKTTVRGIADFLQVEFDVEEAVKGVEGKPRDVATFEKEKVIKVGKDAFFQSKEDILVLNDPAVKIVEVGNVSGSTPQA